MSGLGSGFSDGLFSSIVSDIKSYRGTDPIVPWLRGIRKMKETLTPHLLKQKLPRFLERCSVAFLTDRRYSNDLRYLRVWLQLMDFVDDPKEILITMEANNVGIKNSLFYQAYALYYEKQKKFNAADRIYHLGVQNFAEPAEELQRSYVQFLKRMERQKLKRAQAAKRNSVISNQEWVRENSEKSSASELQPRQTWNKEHSSASVEQVANTEGCDDDIVAVKFADAANVGHSKAEDRLCFNLEEPIINTKESKKTTGSVFQKPLELSAITSKDIAGGKVEIGFEAPKEIQLEDPSMQLVKIGDRHKSFDLFVDDAHATSDKEQVLGKAVQAQKSSKGVSNSQASVWERSNNALQSQTWSKYLNTKKAGQAGFREDTVVYKFVGSAIQDEPELENVWHHGLIDPTVNLKEAMEDINSMFGKSIEFTRKSRRKKVDTEGDTKRSFGEFVILPDDESDDGIDGIPQEMNGHETKSSPEKRSTRQSLDSDSRFLILSVDESDNQDDSNSIPSSHTGETSDLFEQTVCTKEARAEINKLFAMPVDF